MSSLEKYLFRSSAHFSVGLVVFLLLGCMSCLYILETKPLLVVSFTTILSHSVGCLFFFFLMVFFALQKLGSLIRFHWFIFVFISIALRDWPKNIFVWFMSKSICLCSLLGVLWCLVSCLSLHAILSLFLYVVWGCVLVSLFTCNYPFFPASLAEENVLTSFVKD